MSEVIFLPEGYLSFVASNVMEVFVEKMKIPSSDGILFPSTPYYLKEPYRILFEGQRQWQQILAWFTTKVPPDTHHIVYSSKATLFTRSTSNRLMWDSGSTFFVIDHVLRISMQLTLVNWITEWLASTTWLNEAGDLNAIYFRKLENQYLALIGMGSEKIGGLGEILHSQLSGFTGRYRFF